MVQSVAIGSFGRLYPAIGQHITGDLQFRVFDSLEHPVSGVTVIVTGPHGKVSYAAWYGSQNASNVGPQCPSHVRIAFHGILTLKTDSRCYPHRESAQARRF